MTTPTTEYIKRLRDKFNKLCLDSEKIQVNGDMYSGHHNGDSFLKMFVGNDLENVWDWGVYIVENAFYIPNNRKINGRYGLEIRFYEIREVNIMEI